MKKSFIYPLIVALLFFGCEGQKYVVNSNFYQLQAGMTEQEFLQWIQPNYVAQNGRPSSAKLFSFKGDKWKVYVFDLYRLDGTYAYRDHQEYVAFKNGRLEEYGTGELPLTLRQNPNQYTIITK